MTPFVRSIVLASALLTAHGCYVEPAYPVYVEDGTADLVEISPGVEVIADWDEPIFFIDDFYWVFRGGFWWRSGWYGRGWERAGVVPERIRGIEHPERYAHYRPEGYVRHEPVRGGFESHTHYHATHPAPSGMHVRPAPHARGGRR